MVLKRFSYKVDTVEQQDLSLSFSHQQLQEKRRIIILILISIIYTKTVLI